MKKLVFSIDIGGINTAFGLVDEHGEIFAESVISTKAYPKFSDYPRYINDLADIGIICHQRICQIRQRRDRIYV